MAYAVTSKSVHCLDAGLKVGFYEVSWTGGTYTTGGDALDLTSDNWNYIYGAAKLGDDTAADGGYVAQIVTPGIATAHSASNLKITLWITIDPANGGGANVVLQQVANGADVSAIGKLQLVVFGK